MGHDKVVLNAVESDGTVNVPTFRLPPSTYLSEQARKSLPKSADDSSVTFDQMVASGQIQKLHKESKEKGPARAAEAAKRDQVQVEEVTLGGVHGYWVRPLNRHRHRARQILINLPAGGFAFADAATGGIYEAVPLVRLGGFDVLTIDYRQAPEATFPAASEDVASVYRLLLRTHRSCDIGIFGTSAGGLLTAQALAWFQKENLPMPGAAGILAASADARWGGDAWYWFKPLQGFTTPPTLDERFYYGDHDLADPLMSPIESDAVLKRFPPTLIITATRAGEMSAAVNTHRLLIKNHVAAELYVWDGLNHAFYLNTTLPESREAFDVMVSFFDRHLGKNAAKD